MESGQGARKKLPSHHLKAAVRGTAHGHAERSSISADGPPIYPFKLVIPLAGFILLLQGIVEVVRCVQCLRTGEWPSREQDVEEVDVDKLKEMVSAEARGGKL